MRRTNWKTVSTLVTMIVVAGCQDNVVSAPQGTSVAPASIMLALLMVHIIQVSLFTVR